MKHDLTWRKSSRSGANNECVEVAVAAGGSAIRDSKLGDTGPILSFGAAAFATFLDSVKTGRLDG